MWLNEIHYIQAQLWIAWDPSQISKKCYQDFFALNEHCSAPKFSWLVLAETDQKRTVFESQALKKYLFPENIRCSEFNSRLFYQRIFSLAGYFCRLFYFYNVIFYWNAYYGYQIIYVQLTLHPLHISFFSLKRIFNFFFRGSVVLLSHCSMYNVSTQISEYSLPTTKNKCHMYLEAQFTIPLTNSF